MDRCVIYQKNGILALKTRLFFFSIWTPFSIFVIVAVGSEGHFVSMHSNGWVKTFCSGQNRERERW